MVVMTWRRGKYDGLPIAVQGINALVGFDFLSAHYAEVAVAILLKMIFCVLSFSWQLFKALRVVILLKTC